MNLIVVDLCWRRTRDVRYVVLGLRAVLCTSGAPRDTWHRGVGLPALAPDWPVPHGPDPQPHSQWRHRALQWRWNPGHRQLWTSAAKPDTADFVNRTAWIFEQWWKLLQSLSAVMNCKDIMFLIKMSSYVFSNTSIFTMTWGDSRFCRKLKPSIVWSCWLYLKKIGTSNVKLARNLQILFVGDIILYLMRIFLRDKLSFSIYEILAETAMYIADIQDNSLTPPRGPL